MMSASIRSINGDKVFLARPPWAYARSHLRLSTGQSVASRTGVHPTDQRAFGDGRH
jgi:hypothetical protein